MKKIILLIILVSAFLQNSSGAGLTWTKFQILPTAGGISGTMTGISKAPSGNLYVGTAWQGIYKSSNEGAVWTQIGLGATSEDVRCAAKILTNDDKIMFAFAYNISFYEKTLYFSNDYGNTWEIPIAANSKDIKKVQLMPNNTLVALERKTNLLYSTSDVCKTWMAITIPGVASGEIVDIYLSKNNGLFALTKSSGIYNSKDKDLKAWEKMNYSLPVGNITKIAVSDDDRVFLSIDKDAAYFQKADKSGFQKIAMKLYANTKNEVYEIDVLKNNYLVVNYNNDIKGFTTFNTDCYDASVDAIYALGAEGRDVSSFSVLGDEIYVLTSYSISKAKLDYISEVATQNLAPEVLNIKINNRTCTMTSLNNIESVELFDMMGRKIYGETVTGNNYLLDLGNYNSGFYFIEAVVDGNKIINKIVIN